MFTLLAGIIAALVFTVLFVFGSCALLAVLIMTVAGIGDLLSGGSKADDQISSVP